MTKDKKNNTPKPEKKKQRKKEEAINQKATDGEEVNDQVKKKREKHQPRDNA